MAKPQHVIAALCSLHCASVLATCDVAGDMVGNSCSEPEHLSLLQRSRSMVHARKTAAPKVAVVVLAMTKSSDKWLDAFSILAYSAKKAFETSKYQMELVAVTEESIMSSDKSSLEKCGFIVKPLPLPVKVSDVQSDFAREEISKGCCGEVEMLKLYGLSFTEYHRVVVVDGDVLFLGNIDDILHDKTHSLAATYDHELDSLDFNGVYSAIPPINGGFLVFTPNMTDFHSIISTAKQGDFRGGTGWLGLRVGWAYGGVGPQGLLAYHYNKEALEKGRVMNKAPDLPGNLTSGPRESRVSVLDRSRFDVIDTDALRLAFDNKEFGIDDIKTFHFTGKCLKPWECFSPNGAICEKMTDRWWQLRAEYAKERNLKVTPRCTGVGMYQTLGVVS